MLRFLLNFVYPGLGYLAFGDWARFVRHLKLSGLSGVLIALSFMVEGKWRGVLFLSGFTVTIINVYWSASSSCPKELKEAFKRGFDKASKSGKTGWDRELQDYEAEEHKRRLNRQKSFFD